MNKRDSTILLPVLALLVIGAGYLVCSNLLLPSIFEDRAKITAADADISQARAKLDSINQADQSMTKLAADVNNLLLAVPDSVDTPNLITEVESIGVASGVSIPSLSPPTSISISSSGSSANGLATNVTLVGSFQGISTFINSLETSIRYSKITSLTISSSDSGLSASITFNVFSRPALSEASTSGGQL